MAASSQNRMITVVSAHPASSKWWWNGAIRNTRRRVVRNTAICSGHRQRLHHEHPADHDEQQLGAGDDGQPGDQAAQGQRAGVAHEDPGRRGVPPQEPDAAAHRRGRDQRHVERVAHLVAAGAAAISAQLLRNCQNPMIT